jgi:hypothetical protein
MPAASEEVGYPRVSGACFLLTLAVIFSRNASESVCSNAHLARICLHHGLEEIVNHLNASGSESICGARTKKKNNHIEAPKLSKWMLATVTEAIIGAAYCDGGLPAARTVMTALGLFADNADVMATTSLRGASQDVMILSTTNDLSIWTPCRASG